MTSPMKATAWNTGWLFRHLDSQENFVPVTLPHDAMQAEPRTELSANGINGGWYEGRDYEYIRRFTPDKSLRNKTLMLEFEGVYHLAEVYLNGEKIAERPYGYTNFYADLTERIRFDRKQHFPPSEAKHNNNEGKPFSFGAESAIINMLGKSQQRGNPAVGRA